MDVEGVVSVESEPSRPPTPGDVLHTGRGREGGGREEGGREGGKEGEREREEEEEEGGREQEKERVKACSHCISNPDRMHINVRLLRSHCTHVGVKPDWIRIHLNPLQEVVSIQIEVNPV